MQSWQTLNTYVNTMKKTFQAVISGAEFHLRLLVQNPMSTQFHVAGVDCLKIIEDKSSESRVYTPDTRLIRATRAKSKRGAQSPRPQLNCNAKTQSSKPASQRHRSVETRGLKPASQHNRSVKTRGSKPTSQHHYNAKT